MRKLISVLSFLVLLCSQVWAREQGNFTAQHDITLLAAPEILVENPRVTVQRLRAMVHFFGDLDCTAESEVILVTHSSGTQEIFGITTYPMPESDDTCELLGIGFSGQGRSRGKGSGGVLEGSFQIQGRTTESNDQADMHIRGTTITDLSTFPPVDMEGIFFLTP